MAGRILDYAEVARITRPPLRVAVAIARTVLIVPVAATRGIDLALPAVCGYRAAVLEPNESNASFEACH